MIRNAALHYFVQPKPKQFKAVTKQWNVADNICYMYYDHESPFKLIWMQRLVIIGSKVDFTVPYKKKPCLYCSRCSVLTVHCINTVEPHCTVLTSPFVWEIWTCRHSVCCEAARCFLHTGNWVKPLKAEILKGSVFLTINQISEKKVWERFETVLCTVLKCRSIAIALVSRDE